MLMSLAACRSGKAEASRSPTPGHVSQVLVAAAVLAGLDGVVTGGVLAVVVAALTAEVEAAPPWLQPVIAVQPIRAATAIVATERVLSLGYMTAASHAPAQAGISAMTYPGLRELTTRAVQAREPQPVRRNWGALAAGPHGGDRPRPAGRR